MPEIPEVPEISDGPADTLANMKARISGAQ